MMDDGDDQDSNTSREQRRILGVFFPGRTGRRDERVRWDPIGNLLRDRNCLDQRGRCLVETLLNRKRFSLARAMKRRP